MRYYTNNVRAETLALAEMLHRLERRRNDSFPHHPFTNAGWLLYLTLFIAYASGATASTRALQSSNMLTTYDAVHGVEQLVVAGFAAREGSPLTSMDTPVRLTQLGIEKLDQFLQFNLD